MAPTSEEARQQAEAEGLTLLKADNKTGYFGVYLDKRGKPKPYVTQVRRGGKVVSLGSFATAEEAALCIARSPEGRAAAKRAAAPPLLTSDEVGQQVRAAAKRPAAAASLTSEVGRRGAHSLRRKMLPGRREHVLAAVGARSAEEEAEEEAVEAAVEEEAVEAAAEAEAEMELVEVVDVVGSEEAEEADVVVLDAEVVESEESEEEA